VKFGWPTTSRAIDQIPTHNKYNHVTCDDGMDEEAFTPKCARLRTTRPLHHPNHLSLRQDKVAARDTVGVLIAGG